MRCSPPMSLATFVGPPSVTDLGLSGWLCLLAATCGPEDWSYHGRCAQPRPGWITIDMDLLHSHWCVSYLYRDVSGPVQCVPPSLVTTALSIKVASVTLRKPEYYSTTLAGPALILTFSVMGPSTVGYLWALLLLAYEATDLISLRSSLSGHRYTPRTWFHMAASFS